MYSTGTKVLTCEGIWLELFACPAEGFIFLHLKFGKLKHFWIFNFLKYLKIHHPWASMDSWLR